MKAIIRKSILILAVILLVIAMIAGGMYCYGVKRNLAPEAGIVTRIPSGDPELGQLTTYSVQIKCPWHCQPAIAAVNELPTGLCRVGEPEISLCHVGMNYLTWQIKFKVKPYHAGKITSSKLYVGLKYLHGENTCKGIDFTLPGMNVISLNNATNLEEAGMMPEELAWWRQTWLWLVAGICAALLIAYYLLKNRHGNKVTITPWAEALTGLAELRHSFRNGNLNNETCFVKLTEIVRKYLEKRFALRAPQQTSAEFLTELNQPDGMLPETHRPFLKDFITAADLVKFARVAPDEHLLSVALDKAEILILETRPQETAGGKK